MISNSPFYSESHKSLSERISKFTIENVVPHVSLWEKNDTSDINVIKKFGSEGYYKIIVDAIMGSKDYDMFHIATIVNEFAKHTSSGGLTAKFFASFVLGIYPLVKYDSKKFQSMINDVISGNKIICLAVSEPSVGSDFMNIQTTATKKGNRYIVNGNKKWITNGIYSDIIITAVKIDNSDNVSLLAIDTKSSGIQLKQMTCSGFKTSGTTFIIFDNVEVPIENIVGNEGDGFKMILSAFNYERYGSACGAIALSEVCLNESINHVIRRKTFGKELVTRQLVRHKISEMIKEIESVKSWFEVLTYRINLMPNRQLNSELAAQLALLKAKSSKLLGNCSHEAGQMFGGSSYVQGGLGEKIERITRDVRGFEMAGGNGDVISDTGVKILLKNNVMRSRL